MTRSIDQWISIRDGKTWEEFAAFILDDLTHYPVNRRTYYQSDVQTLANVLRAVAQPATEDSP